MTPLSDLISERLAAALEWVADAGRLTRQYFASSELPFERKADDSPVTQADRGAELLLRDRIRQRFTHDGVIGEEFGNLDGTSGFVWVLDPIDGTKSFISGVPLYSQLIAILHEGESVAGIIHLPALEESVFAMRGGGAWWRQRQVPPRRARVSRRACLAEARFVTSQVDSFARRGAGEVFDQLQRRAYVTRTWGDGYGYLLVATGRAELMVDPVMNFWDAAALPPILEEAGGTFTDWQGRPTIRNGEGLATNGLLLEEVLATTRAFPAP